MVLRNSCLVCLVGGRISLRVECLMLSFVSFALLGQFSKLLFLSVLGSTDAASHLMSFVFVVIFCKSVAILV